MNDKFDNLKLATQYWGGDEELSTIIIAIFLLAFITFLLLGLIFQRYLKSKNLKHFFIRYAKNKDLTDEEIEILWKYANKMDRDPMLVLEFKAPFEKAMDLYIKTDPNPKEELVSDMRKKLDFAITSPYVPLVSTKDIEIFQNGRMVFHNNKAIDVALYDKDERYMYWLVIENNLPPNVKPGDIIKIVFIRNEDAIYTITLPIEDIVKDGGKTLVKLPHTFELHRTQRREYPRIKINNPVTVFIKNKDDVIKIEGKFDDISAGGAKICFDKKDDTEVLKNIRYGEIIDMKFKLDDDMYELNLKVLEKSIKAKIICLRGTFEDIDDKTREEIMEFVQKEQLKMIQLKRENV